MVLAQAKDTFPKNKVSVGLGFEFDMRSLVVPLSTRVSMSHALVDVSIVSLTFSVLYLSLFFSFVVQAFPASWWVHK